MINAYEVEAALRNRYPDLESVRDGVFRGVDRFGQRDYAIRYFDLNDQLAESAPTFKNYQEDLLSSSYFSSQVATDLRWSHYLYFVTSDERAGQAEFGRLKARIEGDREYARKQVVREADVLSVLPKPASRPAAAELPADLATLWSNTLEQEGLGFVLDEDITAPDAARRIVAGTKDKAARPVTPMSLLSGERAAASHFIRHLKIKGFRPHPEQKDHRLGRVNLIVGGNGVGKTSLLEAIEYGYCGKNRRASVVLKDTSISLEFVNSKEVLSSTTDLARLRARHANWYAKTELKKVSVHDSFGKFNFLDTDAAVNLSVSASSEQIGSDVKHLVLGAAAENLADRLRRVLEKLQEQLKDIRREKDSNSLLAKDAQARLDAIKNMPMLSDSIFLELLTALSHLGWLQPPETKAGIDDLREDLQNANSAMEIIRRSPIDLLRSTQESGLQFLENLNAEAISAETLDEKAKKSKLDDSKARRDAQSASARLTAIDALSSYARTNYVQLTRQVTEQRDRVRLNAARFSLVTIIVSANDVTDFLSLSIAEARTAAQRRVEEIRLQLATARISLEAFEKTQNSLIVLKQRLISTAQDILMQTPNPDHCPLCHSEFESGQLIVQMMIDVENDTTQLAGQLRSNVEMVDEAMDKANAAMRTIEVLHTFIDGNVELLTVKDGVGQVEQGRAQLDMDRAHVEMLERQVKQLEADGLSSADLSISLAAAGLDELPNLDSLQTLRAEVNETIESYQAVIKKAEEDIKTVGHETDLVARRLSMELSGSPEALFTEIRRQISDLEQALGARQTLDGFVRVGVDWTLDQLATSLGSVSQSLARVATAVAQESSNNVLLDAETKSIESLTSKLAGFNVKIAHGAAAEIILAKLYEQSSGGELVGQILAENAQEIARTFASIHMPNEFEIKVVDGSLMIVRRLSGVKVELNHMSTGQRAAFALSLFLAMNGRLRSGPPVLLFDDPVAHVDDINVLSFLDHLRNLAINGSRQIFFATADTKLAGLFRHKFRFLGDEFQEISLARS